MRMDTKLKTLENQFHAYIENARLLGIDYRMLMQCTLATMIDQSDITRAEYDTVVQEARIISVRLGEAKLDSPHLSQEAGVA